MHRRLAKMRAATWHSPLGRRRRRRERPASYACRWLCTQRPKSNCNVVASKQKIIVMVISRSFSNLFCSFFQKRGSGAPGILIGAVLVGVVVALVRSIVRALLLLFDLYNQLRIYKIRIEKRIKE